VSKGILPYSGLGTGIQRALEQYPHITFKDDKDLNQFKVIIHRKREHLFKYNTLSETLNETIKDTDASLLNLLKENPEMSYDEIAESLNKGRSTIYRSIIKLRREKKLMRMGSRKTGYWKVCESS
jgi:ATP-dependent DNA helicase RecG